ncbi:MAG: hypothetical protein JNM63_00010 [Spirochaetia bacterium]|nr:hypothetical protein [Spirochaetia bacterium]
MLLVLGLFHGPGLFSATNAVSGWNNFLLGSGFSQVTNFLYTTHTWLEPTVDLRTDVVSEVNTNTIRIKPNQHFQSIQFQFRQDKLYLIRLDLSPKLYSFLSLNKSLRAKYGEPNEIRSDRLVWRDGKRELILERNTTLRYLDPTGLPNGAPPSFTNTLNPSVESILNSF